MLPGAGAFDDWMARHTGIGRTYQQQQEAANGGPLTFSQQMAVTPNTPNQPALPAWLDPHNPEAAKARTRSR